jgi:hypothetical protein
MGAMKNLVIEVAQLVHVGNLAGIEQALEVLPQDQKYDALMHAIEANFTALSLCDCAWCESARHER